MSRSFQQFIFDSSLSFSERAIRVFNFQRTNNTVYSRFTDVFGFGENKREPASLSQIPLIPIRVFKEAEVKSFPGSEELLFKSSGTGKMSQSLHFVKESSIYKQAIELEFYSHFAKENTSLLCYTPGYSDNRFSSLIWMLNHLVEQDSSGLSRFIPLQKPLNKSDIADLIDRERNIVLFGAAFGLMDLIEATSDPLPKTAHIVETGGMKTHRREISKSDLRERLSDGFQIPKNQIHSEYGMCELLSQSYAIGSEWFTAPDWVHITVRDPDNPDRICEPYEPGKLGVIDLANLYSCSFILTDDRAIMDDKGRFKVMGRWKNSELRGCNFLIDQE